MKRYCFTITICGQGDSPDFAWEEAVTALAVDPGPTPEEFTIVEDDEE